MSVCSVCTSVHCTPRELWLAQELLNTVFRMIVIVQEQYRKTQMGAVAPRTKVISISAHAQLVTKQYQMIKLKLRLKVLHMRNRNPTLQFFVTRSFSAVALVYEFCYVR